MMMKKNTTHRALLPVCSCTHSWHPICWPWNHCYETRSVKELGRRNLRSGSRRKGPKELIFIRDIITVLWLLCRAKSIIKPLWKRGSAINLLILYSIIFVWHRNHIISNLPWSWSTFQISTRIEAIAGSVATSFNNVRAIFAPWYKPYAVN